jgi:nicotinamidase-related amidase
MDACRRRSWGRLIMDFRVILVRDGVCSSSDEGHDALLQIYHRRFSEQIETASAEILARWR